MSLRSFWLAAAGAVSLAIVFPFHTGCQGTCTSSAECGEGDYCAITTGACLTPKSVGFCKSKPEACTGLVSPVCGCNGVTYNNACLAAQAGQSIGAAGKCGNNCGGLNGTTCETGQFCDFSLGACAQSDPTGTCATVPNSCPDVLAPVCGCDSKTYGNSCKASQSQVSIANAGECTCGGPNQVPCEEGRYCEFAVGACLGPNPTGVCKTVPVMCSGVQSPVCGCDGVTYTNLCIAAQHQVSVTGTQKCIVPDAGADAATDAGSTDGGD